MRKFRIKRIQERDASGRLVTAGLAWIEGRVRLTYACIFVTILGAYVGVSAMVIAQYSSLRPYWKDMAWEVAHVVCVVTVVAVAISIIWGARWRSLVFHSDGSMEAPLGFPFTSREETVGPLHAEVVSIESSSFDGTECFVMMHTREGDAFAVARGLYGWQARKVTVMLNIALRDIRDSAAHDRRFAGRAAEIA